VLNQTLNTGKRLL